MSLRWAVLIVLSASLLQVKTLKVSGLDRFIQVVHRVVQKSCRTACQLLCCPIDRMLCHRPSYTYCPGKSLFLFGDDFIQLPRCRLCMETCRTLALSVLILYCRNTVIIRRLVTCLCLSLQISVINLQTVEKDIVSNLTFLLIGLIYKHMMLWNSLRKCCAPN